MRRPEPSDYYRKGDLVMPEPTAELAALERPDELDAWLIQHAPLLRDAYVAYVVARAAAKPSPEAAERPPGWINPLSNFGDDENDRMPWQSDD